MQANDEAKFCEVCGARLVSAGEQHANENLAEEAKKESANANRPNDAQAGFTAPGTAARSEAADMEYGKAMAVLAYLNILVLIPLLAAKDSKFARYHTNQGMILWITWIIAFVALRILAAVAALLAGTIILAGLSALLLILICILALAVWGLYIALVVIGIINAATGVTKELPVIGKLRLLQ